MNAALKKVFALGEAGYLRGAALQNAGPGYGHT